MDANRTRPLSAYLLMACVLFQGVSGIAGGIGLVADPTGENLGIPQAWLQGSPFTDYMIPGLVLFVVLGVFPLVVLYGLWRRQYWGWIGALIVGLALLIWIGVEVLVIGYQPQPPLQVIYGTLGLAIVILTMLPGVRTHYAPDDASPIGSEVRS
jgi:peptidoglycan/LPS O-acetylase OafA/YrhL